MIAIWLTNVFCTSSFSRYLIICHNNFAKKYLTLRNSVLCCVGLWVVAFLMEMPNFLGWGGHYFDPAASACLWDRETSLSYTMFMVFVGVGLPAVLIAICNFAVYYYVHKKEIKVAPSSGRLAAASVARSSRMSLRLSRTFTVIFIAYVAFWLPYSIIILLDFFYTSRPVAYLYSLLLAHMSSSINSLLYAATNRDFREGYRKLLTKVRIISKGRGATEQASHATFNMTRSSRVEPAVMSTASN